MFKTKRKRAVVLALIAFFCTAAATYVAVDWKRFGGGFLAFFKGGKGDAVVASTGGTPGSNAGRMAPGDNSHSTAPALPTLVAVASRRHTSGIASGAVGHKSDDDLFKYGDPAAGGIPANSFVVAQNDTPGGGNDGGAGAPAGGEGGPGVSSPAPAPAGIGAGPGDGDLLGGGTGTPPPAATPPAATPPAGSPPASPPIDAPAPAPTQSGTTDDPGTLPPSPPPSLPPVSAVPEASSLAMMSLGALFLAVAAARKRKQA
jgi:hypothetical protein